MEDDRTGSRISREQLRLKLRSFDPDGSYYALTLGANRRGHPFWSVHSHWVGWSERNPTGRSERQAWSTPDA